MVLVIETNFVCGRFAAASWIGGTDWLTVVTFVAAVTFELRMVAEAIVQTHRSEETLSASASEAVA